MELKGSKTETNLINAFIGESQARNKYTFYASKAQEEGYEQISAIFEETSNNEKEHAELWFKELNNGKISNTIDNLISSAKGEHYEWTNMYLKMAFDAKEEGFDKIAFLFEGVAKIEKSHEDRYLKLIQNINNDEVFNNPIKKFWSCRNCGHTHYGNEAPIICPVCSHPVSFFEIKAENY